MNTQDRTKLSSEITALESQASVAQSALEAASDDSQRFEQQIILRGLNDRIAALTRALND